MNAKLRHLSAALTTVALAVGQLTLSVIPAHAALVSLAPMVTKDLTTPGYTALTLAQDLMGSGVTSVSNATYKGASAQLGTIDIADPAVVSFNHGVILSSGNIADIVGPNKSESTTGDMAAWPGVNPGSQDADLTSLISGTQTVNPMTYDAASLEFDFVPTSSDIYFTYVFGSDEYLEWVNLYNDVFGFWVTNGSGQKANCAVNSAGAPVSIDTINSNVDSTEYRDNSFMNPPATPINIESDGLTVEMICHASVTPNAVNHIKLAIADTSDQVLDSQVILKAASLSTTKPESCNNGVDDNANGATDMSDAYCQATTTPAPPGIVNPSTTPGGTVPPTYTGAPFAGSEGQPIWLDANALNWDLTTASLATSWQVYVNGNTAAQCAVYNPDGTPQTHQPRNADGTYALAYAICPQDGKYTARIDGWDFENKSASDKDVDFTINNAPPSIDSVNLTNSTAVDAGTPLTVDAYVSDAPGDTISCLVDFGDGTKVSVVPDATGLCSATSTYAKAGNYMLQVKATDNQNDSSAFLSVATVSAPIGALTAQSISVSTAAPASAAYGNTFTVAASATSGLPVTVSVTGPCSVSGYAVTMSSATGSCVVNLDQAGDGTTWDVAPTVTQTVSATTRPITVTAAAKTKVWGSADPALTYSVTSGNLVGTDALAGSLTRTAGENLGTYPITKGTLANASYAITFVGANLTITGVAPAISTNPTAVTATVGTAVTFASAGSGKPTPTVQWQVLAVGGTWTNIAGATAASYGYTVATGDNGKQFRAVYTNSLGTATTTSAAITIPAAPTITAITPTSGGVGTSVTITGTNLSGATSVKFAGTTASALFTVLSSTSIVTSVPAGATVAGGIVVATPGGTATSASFKPATTLVVPTVTAYSTSATRAGTAVAVTLTGTNLAGATSATLGSVSLAFTVKGATSLLVQVPATGVVSGPIKVVTAGGTSANTIVFSVLSAPVQLTAGASHSCAVLADATLKCWGLNTNGQLGNGTTTQSTSPVVVTGVAGAKQVAAGAAFSCAVLTDSTVRCWGLNTNGQLGNNTTTQSTTAVQVKATATTNLTGVSSIALGGAFACAVLTDSTVRCWGLGTSGQLGNGAALSSNLPVTVTGLSGVTAITAGGTTACALLNTGAVKCWGANANGQLGNGTTATTSTIPVQVTGIDGSVSANKALAIDAGDNHVCAVITGGTLKCWGLNTNGQLGDGTTTKRTAPVSVLASAGVALTGVSAITAGASHSCAIIGTGSTATAKCWGINTNGVLGNGTTTQSLYPVAVVATLTTGISQIVAGGTQTLGLAPSSALAPVAVVAWGGNTNGQLGDASTTARTNPVALGTI